MKKRAINLSTAEKIAALPQFILRELAALSSDQGNLISIRIGERPRFKKNGRFSYKNVLIKTKTSTTQQGGPIVAGFIPEDQTVFGRTRSEPLGSHHRFLQLITNLEDITAGIERGEYVDLEFEEKTLRFRWHDVLFSIDLASADQNQYPVSYLPMGAKELKPLKILVDAEGLPITSDLDVFMIAMPTRFYCPAFFTSYDTGTAEGLLELIRNMMILQSELLKTRNYIAVDILRQMNEFRDVGVVSPYEMLLMMQFNVRCSRRTHRWTPVLQHGPDNRGPGKDRSNRAVLLHFYQGQCFVTEGEQQLQEFLFDEALLQGYVLALPKNFQNFVEKAL